MSAEFIVWFDDYRDSDRPRVGGKNASLGELVGAGLPVPPGFALTTEAYHFLRADADLSRRVRGLLSGVDLNDMAHTREISTEVRYLIENAEVHASIEEAIRVSYRKLCADCGVEDLPVAVRSSATAEDLPDASFAGQQDTFLWVKGEDAVFEKVRQCWSSIFTDRAMAYRHEMGHEHEVISMSVGIQKMVHPKTAGVAFTLNPSDGDPSQIAIDASYGFGEAVVSGEVTPDNFLVDKVLLQVTRRTISPKTVEFVLDEERSGVVVREIEPERSTRPCLADDEVISVAAMAKAVERHYGSPQDIEWAIDCELPAGDGVVLLQSRPETVWSRKKRRQVARAGETPLEGIVSTLLAPIHTRAKASTVERET
jgi:pyruvate,water dikinase